MLYVFTGDIGGL